jgi:hypothetical protein
MDYLELDPKWFGGRCLFLPMLPCEKYYFFNEVHLTERKKNRCIIRLTLNYGGVSP